MILTWVCKILGVFYFKDLGFQGLENGILGLILKWVWMCSSCKCYACSVYMYLNQWVCVRFICGGGRCNNGDEVVVSLIWYGLAGFGTHRDRRERGTGEREDRRGVRMTIGPNSI